jgi:hypothetical protein
MPSLEEGAGSEGGPTVAEGSMFMTGGGACTSPAAESGEEGVGISSAKESKVRARQSPAKIMRRILFMSLGEGGKSFHKIPVLPI